MNSVIQNNKLISALYSLTAKSPTNLILILVNFIAGAYLLQLRFIEEDNLNHNYAGILDSTI